MISLWKSINTLHDTTNDLLEIIFYQSKGIDFHTDGHQLKQKSNIYVYNVGIPGYVSFKVSSIVYRLSICSNSMYGFIFNDKQGIVPRDLIHSKNLTECPHDDKYAVSFVFRNLHSFYNVDLKLRWQQETNIISPCLDWNDVLKCKLKLPKPSRFPWKKDLSHPLVLINTLDTLLPCSNYTEHIGPGDEIHSNPLAAAILGVHTRYICGNSLCGTSELGACCIRLGRKEDIIHSSYVIYRGQSFANQDTEDVKGQTNYMKISFEKFPNYPIAVLLTADVPWYERRYPRTQYYLGNFFIHYYHFQLTQTVNVDTKGEWIFHLRSYPKQTSDINHDYCFCCRKI